MAQKCPTKFSEFDSSSFPDTRVIVVEDREFVVSPSYLSMWSGYFRVLFNGNFKEAKEKIELKDLKAELFELFLDAVYPCLVPINEDTAPAISSLDDRFDSPHLFRLADDVMYDAVREVREESRQMVAAQRAAKRRIRDVSPPWSLVQGSSRGPSPPKPSRKAESPRSSPSSPVEEKSEEDSPEMPEQPGKQGRKKTRIRKKRRRQKFMEDMEAVEEPPDGCVSNAQLLRAGAASTNLEDMASIVFERSQEDVPRPYSRAALLAVRRAVEKARRAKSH